MTYIEFFEITKKLDKNKYHVSCEIEAISSEAINWAIFRKDMSMEEYFSESNQAILDSDNNSKEDLIEFCRGCYCE